MIFRAGVIFIPAFFMKQRSIENFFLPFFRHLDSSAQKDVFLELSILKQWLLIK